MGNDFCISESEILSPSISPTINCIEDEMYVKLVIQTDMYGDETSWKIQDNDGLIIESEESYESFETYTKQLCLPYNCYTLVVYDDFGDGLCNVDYYYYYDDVFYDDYECGYYKLFVNGDSLIMGSEFLQEESNNFCISGYPTQAPSESPTE